MIVQVDRCYKDLKPVGKGSYGIVCSAFNTESGEHVAIKKVSPISTHVIDAKHVLREIRMMRQVSSG
jgi:serine/threonine protein kinase